MDDKFIYLLCVLISFVKWLFDKHYKYKQSEMEHEENMLRIKNQINSKKKNAPQNPAKACQHKKGA